MLDGAMLVWFVLTGASFAFVLWDSVFNGVTSWVQRIAWILVTAYTGPVGAFVYVLACRRPFPGGHDRYTAASWKQGVNSEMHCLAGDATGIIVAASIVPAFGLANGWDILIEYAAGFVSGLFIFQALMMIGMYDGKYFLAVRKTFFAETISMNMVMTGMIPVMVLLAAAWPGSMDPLSWEFWFRMSLATVVGGLIAFPINYWLVANHLKHGCMTLPGADEAQPPGLGHRSPEPSLVKEPQRTHAHAMTEHADHSGHPHRNGHESPRSRRHGNHAESRLREEHPGHADPSGHDGHAEHAVMGMRELRLGTELAWVFATYILLFGALWLTAQWVPIRFV